MTEKITKEISDRICKHMNEDHTDAVVLYAKVYGKTEEAETAKMVSIDSQGMNLEAKIQGNTVPIRLEFDHVLEDAEAAHHTLIDMVKTARKMKQ